MVSAPAHFLSLACHKSPGPCPPGFLSPSPKAHFSLAQLRYPKHSTAIAAATNEFKSTTQAAEGNRGQEAAQGQSTPTFVQALNVEFNLPRSVRTSLSLSKFNERFFGRMAMFGIVSAVVAELTTGKAPLAHLFGLESGVTSILDLDLAILFMIGFNIYAALMPGSSQSGGEPVAGGRVGDQAAHAKVLGGPSCTKCADLSLGRLAQLGLAISLIAEALTGKGVLAHMEVETGVPLCEMDPGLLIVLTFMLLAAISPSKGKKYQKI